MIVAVATVVVATVVPAVVPAIVPAVVPAVVPAAAPATRSRPSAGGAAATGLTLQLATYRWVKPVCTASAGVLHTQELACHYTSAAQMVLLIR